MPAFIAHLLIGDKPYREAHHGLFTEAGGLNTTTKAYEDYVECQKQPKRYAPYVEAAVNVSVR